jgi:hypothetical protein
MLFFVLGVSLSETMPRIIQFMHPGGEVTVRRDGSKPWNEGMHRRAFLRASQALTADLTGGQTRHDEVVLWAEWEAEATAVQTAALDGAGGHDWLSENILTPIARPPPADARNPQNTDPFVFGPTFLYCCCKQVRANGSATILRALSPGSLVIFGSQLDGVFVLDTVFVVADGEDYDAARGPEVFHQRVPAAFVDVTLKPLAWTAEAYADPDTKWSEEDELRACGACRGASLGSQFRLYRGATPEKPVNDMFSFSPCRPTAHPEPGFARPRITGAFVNPALNMGFRQYPHGREATEAEVNDTWRRVADQVLANRLLLGTHFELPAQQPGAI